jgi:hypothetical protein
VSPTTVIMCKKGSLESLSVKTMTQDGNYQICLLGSQWVPLLYFCNKKPMITVKFFYWCVKGECQ